MRLSRRRPALTVILTVHLCSVPRLPFVIPTKLLTIEQYDDRPMEQQQQQR